MLVLVAAPLLSADMGGGKYFGIQVKFVAAKGKFCSCKREFKGIVGNTEQHSVVLLLPK